MCPRRVPDWVGGWWGGSRWRLVVWWSTPPTSLARVPVGWHPSPVPTRCCPLAVGFSTQPPRAPCAGGLVPRCRFSAVGAAESPWTAGSSGSLATFACVVRARPSGRVTPHARGHECVCVHVFVRVHARVCVCMHACVCPCAWQRLGVPGFGLTSPPMSSLSLCTLPSGICKSMERTAPSVKAPAPQLPAVQLPQLPVVVSAEDSRQWSRIRATALLHSGWCSTSGCAAVNRRSALAFRFLVVVSCGCVTMHDRTSGPCGPRPFAPSLSAQRWLYGRQSRRPTSLLPSLVMACLRQRRGR